MTPPTLSASSPFIIVLENVPGDKNRFQIETWRVDPRSNDMVRSRPTFYGGYLAAVSAAADLMDANEMPILLDKVDIYNYE